MHKGKTPTDATYWPVKSYANRYGEYQHSNPVDIKIRIEKKSEELDRSNYQSHGVMHEVLADREIAVGSLIRLGKLNTVPTPPDNLFIVRESKNTPIVSSTAKSTNYLKLGRYRGEGSGLITPSAAAIGAVDTRDDVFAVDANDTFILILET